MEPPRVRNLRILQWQDGKPTRGQCTRCERLFTLNEDPTSAPEAHDDLAKQFRSHFCRQAEPVPRVA